MAPTSTPTSVTNPEPPLRAMKHRHFIPVSRGRTTLRIAATAVVSLAPVQLLLAEPAENTAGEPAANWATYTVGGAFLDGNKAAYQSAAGRRADFWGGLSDLHWTAESNDVEYLIDGHALFGSQDFGLLMSATKEDLGYLKLGYKQFRTWYDGSGGYVPGAAPDWDAVFDDNRHVDRGEVWLEAGLRMEDLPKATFRYTHAWRDGTKDSTAWGRSTSGYGHVPSINDLDERRDTFNLAVEHTLGNTDLGLSLTYENGSIKNKRQQRHSPGGAPASDQTLTTSDLTDYDLFSGGVWGVTRFNDEMMLSYGYSYLTMDTDSGGRRSTLAGNGTLTEQYVNLAGGANHSLHTLNTAFNWLPVPDLSLTASLRASWEDTDTVSHYVAGTPQRSASNRDYDTLAEELEIRYTGLDHLVAYARAEFEQADDRVHYRNTAGFLRRKDVDANREKYVIGANYYPIPGLSFSAQYYRQNFDADYSNSYDPLAGNPLDAHLAGYDSKTDDVNFRVTWRARPNLTFVTRYDFQRSTLHSQGIDGARDVLGTVESADITRHVLSQSVTWLPTQRAYLQGTIGFIWADTDSPADQWAPMRVSDSRNDSITANLTAGYALNEFTDLFAGYTFLYARNLVHTHDGGGASGSVPYGTDLEEHIFNIGVAHRINPNMTWNMSYGYYTSNDGTSGGRNDFDAHMLSTGLQIRF